MRSPLLVRNSWRTLIVLVLVGVPGGLTVLADDPANGELPAAFSKTVPETPQDLLAIQKHVQALVKKLHPATVGVRVGGASGSGVIVSKDGYVLTAGHVSGTPNRDAEIILSDGRKLKGKSLGRNQCIDSGMIKI